MCTQIEFHVCPKCVSCVVCCIVEEAILSSISHPLPSDMLDDEPVVDDQSEQSADAEAASAEDSSHPEQGGGDGASEESDAAPFEDEDVQRAEYTRGHKSQSASFRDYLLFWHKLFSLHLTHVLLHQSTHFLRSLIRNRLSAYLVIRFSGPLCFSLHTLFRTHASPVL